MANFYPFVQGVFSNEFLQLKTTDNIYLKDLLEQTLFPSLEAYNASVDNLAALLCYRFDDISPNQKKLFGDNSFSEISDLEVPPTKSRLDSWNTPQPLIRLGSANKMTLEVIKQMTSKQIIAYQNTVYLADRKRIIKGVMQNICTMAPSARVDCLTSLLASPVPLWAAGGTDSDIPRTNGQITFANTHNHYQFVDVADTFDDDDIQQLLATILEHEDMGAAQLILWLRSGSSELSQLKALTKFRPVELTASLIGAVNPNFTSTGIVQALVNGKKIMSNSASIVGTYREAIVVETPDLPSYYVMCTAYFGDNNVSNVLGWRESPAFKGLVMMSPTGENPIIGHNAQFRRYFSGYVNNRSAAAVMYTHHASVWAEPSFS
jgi:hypothetical protein